MGLITMPEAQVRMFLEHDGPDEFTPDDPLHGRGVTYSLITRFVWRLENCVGAFGRMVQHVRVQSQLRDWRKKEPTR